MSKFKLPAPVPEGLSHEQRIAAEAQRHKHLYRLLFEAYMALDGILSAMPLKSVIGPTEHHEYAGLIRDLSLRGWREIESVHGPTTAGKRMALTVVVGGRSTEGT